MITPSTPAQATIEADRDLPIIRITRDFIATPAQLVRAHTDPELFARWVGPDATTTVIDRWDARTGGGYRYLSVVGEESYGFFGSFHEITEDRLVQTFTFEGFPESVSLETMRFEDLGNGRTRMHSQSLTDSIEARDAMLSSGMEVGINDGYAKLDAVLADGAL